MSNHNASRDRTGWRRLLEALGLVALGLVGALAAGEVFLRLVRPQVFEIHPPGMYREDPILGYALTPDFDGVIQRSEFNVPLRIGRGGLRGWEGGGKGSDTLRILVMGDSQAFGFGVRDDETLAAQLEAMLSDTYPDLAIEVIDGGVPGYGTADQLTWLRHEGAGIDPDLIILQFLSVNDLKENRYPAVTWAAIEDGMLTAKSSSEPAEEEFLDFVWRWHRYLKLHSHLARLLSDSAGYLTIRLGWSGSRASLWGEDFTAEDADLGQRLLVEFAQAGQDIGASILLLYTTGQAHVLNGTVATLRSREVLRAAAESAGVPWIDVAAEMSWRPDRLELYYRKDGHWTAVGHRATAEIISQHLASTIASLASEPSAILEAEIDSMVEN